MDKVRPGYRWYRHCVLLAEVLQRVADGQLRRLMVFMPPRHGKSELVSRLFTAYYLYRFPERWVGISSYAAELAYTLSRASRDNFRSAGGQLRDDAAAVKHWETPDRGGLWASGVGGPITGKGWHLGVIDDPLKNAEEAASKIIREKQKEWYRSTFYTREEPNSDGDPDGALVIIQTRWDGDDLSGWLLSRERDEEEDADPEGWHIVNFPAISEEASEDFPTTCTVEPDWRKPGEALCPERRPLEKLKRIARRIGEYFFGALYQQRPRPREGNLFKQGWFRYFREEPEYYVLCGPLREERIRKADCWRFSTQDWAATAKTKGDYTANATWAVTPKRDLLLLEVARERWEGPEAKGLFRTQFAKWQPQIAVVEQNGLGLTLTQDLIREGYPIRGVTHPPGADKTARAQAIASRYEAGTVYHRQNASWLGDYEEELLGFPGKHDDQVDTASAAAKFLTPGASVFQDFAPGLHIAAETLSNYDDERPLVVGWAFDPVFVAVVTQEAPRSRPSEPAPWLIYSVYDGQPEAGLGAFVQRVADTVKREFPGARFHHVGPAPCAGVKQPGQPTKYPDAWLSFAPVNWSLNACLAGEVERNELIRARLRSLQRGQAAVQIDPGAGLVLETLSGAYQYRSIATGFSTEQTEAGPHSACATALGCAASQLYAGALEPEAPVRLTGTAMGVGSRSGR